MSAVLPAASQPLGPTGLTGNVTDYLLEKSLQRGERTYLITPEHNWSFRAIADRARGYVTGKRMLGEQVRRRAAWYRGRWERRDELNRILLERVPELALPADVLQAEG